MTVKYIDKKKLHYKNGLFLDAKGRAMMPKRLIIQQANRLDTLVQQRDYLKEQGEAQPAPTLDSFVRMHEGTGYEFRAQTPLLDAKVEEAEKLIDEIEKAQAIEDIDSHVEEYQALLEFVDDDEVLVDDSVDLNCLEKFDLPVLKNPLELDVQRVMQAIAYAYCNTGTPFIYEDVDEGDEA